MTRGVAVSVVLAVVALGTACERVVDVDIPDPDRRLVVEGRIELIKEAPSSAQRIRLTTTDAFFSQEAPPPATGATVSVTDGAGASFTFTETAPGIYETTSLMGRIGETYTLSIDYAGDRYRSSAAWKSESLSPNVEYRLGRLMLIACVKSSIDALR